MYKRPAGRGRYFHRQQRHVCLFDLARVQFPREDMTLQEFVRDYCPDRIPVIIRVSVGYCGANDVDFTFSIDETYLVTHVKRQTRVLLKDTSGQMLSFPDSHKAKFHVLHDDIIPEGSVAKHLCEIIQEHSMTGQKIHLTAELAKDVEVYSGPGHSTSVKMGRYELNTTYEERYLIGNITESEKLNSLPLVIPLWMPISISVASGIREGNLTEYQEVKISLITSSKQLMKKVVAVTRGFDNDSALGNKEIMLFEGDLEDFEGDYDTIEPYDYYNFNAPGWHNKSQQKEYSSVKQRQPPPLLNIKSTRTQPKPCSEENNICEDVGGTYELVEYPTQGDEYSGYSSTKPVIAVSPNVLGSSRENITPITLQDSIQKLKGVSSKAKEENHEQYASPVITTNKYTFNPAGRIIEGGESTPTPGVNNNKPSTTLKGLEECKSPATQEVDRKPQKEVIKKDVIKCAPRPAPKPSKGNFKASCRDGGEELKIEQKPGISRKPGKTESSDRNEELKSDTKPNVTEQPGKTEKRTEDLTSGESATKAANSNDCQYGDFAKLPKELANMSVEDVADCLKILNLSQYSERFMEEAVDGQLLMSLDKDMLIQHFQFSPFEALKIAKLQSGWRPMGRSDKNKN